MQKWIPFEVRMEGIDVNNFWTKTGFKMFQLKPYKIFLNLYYFTINFALVFLKGSYITNFPQFWAFSDPLPFPIWPVTYPLCCCITKEQINPLWVTSLMNVPKLRKNDLLSKLNYWPFMLKFVGKTGAG